MGTRQPSCREAHMIKVPMMYNFLMYSHNLIKQNDILRVNLMIHVMMPKEPFSVIKLLPDFLKIHPKRVRLHPTSGKERNGRRGPVVRYHKIGFPPVLF